MRYVVTGATGFVGGALTRLALSHGHAVTAIVRDEASGAPLAGAGAQLHRGDVTDRSSLVGAMDGADGLFHLAGWYRVGARDSTPAWHVNVEGTRNVLEAAQHARVGRVVYTSTLAVNSDTGGRVVDESYRFTGRHVSAYDETKAAAHDIACDFAGHGLPVIIAMPGGIYGPGDTSQIGELTAQVVAGRRVFTTDGPQMCMAHVDDVVRGHLLAMEKGKPGESYFFAGPRIALGDLLDLVADIAGARRPLHVPNGVAAVMARLATFGERIVALPPALASETLRAASVSYLGSPVKAERELGWSARPLPEGLQHTIESLRTRR